jgi:hypothetical protein
MRTKNVAGYRIVFARLVDDADHLMLVCERIRYYGIELSQFQRRAISAIAYTHREMSRPHT